MKDQVKKVKEHLQENKKYYLVGGICLAVGAVGAALIVPKNIAIQIAAAKMVEQNVHQDYLKGRMHPGIRLLHNETGIEYPSVRYAAEQLGLHRAKISKHLQGKLADVDGQHFTNNGLMEWPSQ